jgi:acyl-CoA reductase-like NAD-dependent aldehyde dehydrogenase
MMKKNPYAVALGRSGAKKRWAKTTPEERRAYAMKLVEARRAKKRAS